jgi:hypothetical protein
MLKNPWIRIPIKIGYWLFSFIICLISAWLLLIAVYDFGPVEKKIIMFIGEGILVLGAIFIYRAIFKRPQLVRHTNSSLDDE